MAVDSDSYGTVAGVAGRVRSMTAGGATPGVFDANTNPTLANVEAWINQFSADLNGVLAAFRFDVPVSQATVAKMLVGLVEEAVAEMVHYSRGFGRFFTQQGAVTSKSPGAVLRKEFYDWVDARATGLENLGASRTEVDGEETMSAGVLSLNFAAHGDDPEMTS
jgi:hypothetical protein